VDAVKRLLAYVGAIVLASFAIMPYTGVSLLVALWTGISVGCACWALDRMTGRK
jgi:hypothetical protein